MLGRVLGRHRYVRILINERRKSCADYLIEKYGTFGLGELGECGEERLAGYTGSGTNKQGQIINGELGKRIHYKNIAGLLWRFGIIMDGSMLCCLVHTVDIEDLPRDLGNEIEGTGQSLSPFLLSLSLGHGAQFVSLSTPTAPPFFLSALQWPFPCTDSRHICVTQSFML
jgi:hypothetical protein